MSACCHFHQRNNVVPHYDLTEKGKQGLRKLDMQKQLKQLEQIIKSQGVTLIYSEGCMCGTGDCFTPIMADECDVEANSVRLQCGTYGDQRFNTWFIATAETREWLDFTNVHNY